MKKLDLNCMIGDWPFHRVRRPRFDDLKTMHGKVGINGGLVSSTKAIFWNDPYEADRLLAKELEGQADYRPVMTVNPKLVAWRDDLDRAKDEIKPAAVRITPGFHNYTMDDPEMQELAEELVTRNLPLILTMHMVDERNIYLMQYNTVDIDLVRDFINRNPKLTVLLANLRVWELKKLEELIKSRDNLFFDVSGLKDDLCAMQLLKNMDMLPYTVYGSMSPLFCIPSTTITVERQGLSQEEVNELYSARRFMEKLN